MENYIILIGGIIIFMIAFGIMGFCIDMFEQYQQYKYHKRVMDKVRMRGVPRK